jgi:hypothetical protein
MTGIDMIGTERARQMSQEGWDSDHDDEYDENQLAWAAVCYAAPSNVYREVPSITHPPYEASGVLLVTEPMDAELVDPWPWSDEWDKRGKHDRIRQLVIAGALIAAEIDRLQRDDSSI